MFEIFSKIIDEIIIERIREMDGWEINVKYDQFY